VRKAIAAVQATIEKSNEAGASTPPSKCSDPTPAVVTRYAAAQPNDDVRLSWAPCGPVRAHRPAGASAECTVPTESWPV